jgi:competence protein ComEA
VKDAIQKAGGMTEKAIQARINLAAPLEDGHQVVVPEEGQELAVQTASEATDGGETAQTGLNEPLNLNTASQQELETLPGVGPVTAEKIIAYREEQDFSRIEEIQKVSGIGPATFEKLKDLITVESTP